MEVIVSRGCGLDVHQATVVACLLTGEPGTLPRKQVKTLSAMTEGLFPCQPIHLSGGVTGSTRDRKAQIRLARLRRPEKVMMWPTSSTSPILKRLADLSDEEMEAELLGGKTICLK
jgi:hypothetical protein